MNPAFETRDDRVLVLSEMAAYLRCSDQTVRKMIRNGRIKGSYKIGNEYRIRFDVLKNLGLEKR
jgi:excisionase family DNA binding protein